MFRDWWYLRNVECYWFGLGERETNEVGVSKQIQWRDIKRVCVLGCVTNIDYHKPIVFLYKCMDQSCMSISNIVVLLIVSIDLVNPIFTLYSPYQCVFNTNKSALMDLKAW